MRSKYLNILIFLSISFYCNAQSKIDSVTIISNDSLRNKNGLKTNSIESDKLVKIKNCLDSLVNEIKILLNHAKTPQVVKSENINLDIQKKVLKDSVSINNSCYIDKKNAQVDTLLFDSFTKFIELDSAKRIKSIAIIYTDELSKFRANSIRLRSIDISKINDKISFLEQHKINWSDSQKKYIEKVIQNSKYNITYLELVRDNFNKILKSKKIDINDLMKLKRLYDNPIQQQYISEIQDELGF